MSARFFGRKWWREIVKGSERRYIPMVETKRDKLIRSILFEAAEHPREPLPDNFDRVKKAKETQSLVSIDECGSSESCYYKKKGLGRKH